MASKRIAFLISCPQEYIRHTGSDAEKNAAAMNHFFMSISNVYIPLLNVFSSLEKDCVDFNVSLVLPPSLCSLLEDDAMRSQYVEWLDRRAELGAREVSRLRRDAALCDGAKRCVEKARSDKRDFTEKYGGRLLPQFKEHSDRGRVELLATCGTGIFLPHYADMEEIVNAQVETGLYARKIFFGEAADGFYLPYMGYAPGIEKTLKAYGALYTVVDARSFLFSGDCAARGIFSPALCSNSLVALARSNAAWDAVFGAEGLSKNPVYLDLNRDIGFELPLSDLAPLAVEGSPRFASGFCYWRRGGLGVYDARAAAERREKDAEEFVSRAERTLGEAEACVKGCDDLSLVCAFSADDFLSGWMEGVDWLGDVFRKGADSSVSFACLKTLASRKSRLLSVNPSLGSSEGNGYGDNLLSSANAWMARYARKASRRMVDLAERFPNDTGLKACLLNLGARELMMAQSAGWAKMIDAGTLPEYARKRFIDSVLAFTNVFEALGSNSVSTEWLTKIESEYLLFPWINYRIFSKKY